MLSCESGSIEIDDREALFRLTLDCYLTMMVKVSDCLEAIAPEFFAPYQDQFARLRQRLAFDPGPATLEESRSVFASELASFSNQIRSRRDQRLEDLHRLLIVLSQSGDAFALRRDSYSDRLRHFSREVEEIASIHDPVLVSHKLQAELNVLRAFVEAVSEENDKTLARARDQIEEFRDRLDTAESPTSIELERQIAERVGANRPFSLLLFELDGLDNVSRDHVLIQVATALKCQVRGRDFVCRSGANEFAVVLECSEPVARARAAQTAQWLAGGYRVVTEGQQRTVHVSLSVGVAERREDETASQLIARASALLQQQQDLRRAATGGG